jgi:dolichyl-phosphate beta-glucosyltransferase
MTAAVGLVLPVYNEERRLDLAQLGRLAACGDVSVLVVDDGSSDGTVDLLGPLVASGGVRLLRLDRNSGKSEAVRRGMVKEMERGAAVIGYADADFATPVSELLRLAELSRRRPELDAVLSARVRLAGRRVERRALRHYLGRVVATFIDLRVGLRVYDTQCGAKFFRLTPELQQAVREPFCTRWLFDVELLVRLRDAAAKNGREMRLLEEPLECWVDVRGSRLRGVELTRVLRDFASLERELRMFARNGRRSLARRSAA